MLLGFSDRETLFWTFLSVDEISFFLSSSSSSIVVVVGLYILWEENKTRKKDINGVQKGVSHF